ncbi:polyadenylate-binding protein 8 [Citrus sinensis]|uniref:Polyadenylate-binding protein 8 n=1 Tax=Citrus sinensis TaxID=2711 RepID=A0ACB8ITF4_CITSI|nr:polyadenylate-binding protein 8 [Citrus sinensis]
MEVSLRAHNNNDSAILGTLFSLYVGDLDSTVTEQQLIQTFSFSKLEGLASAMLCVDSFHRRSLRYGYANFHSFHCDGKSKGYGFVQYSTPESALNAIEKLYAATVEGMELYLSVKIMRTNRGISKGFGFVCFSNPDEANGAINTLNGILVSSKAIAPNSVRQYRGGRMNGHAKFSNGNQRADKWELKSCCLQ